MMAEQKPWYMSRTIWAAIVGILAVFSSSLIRADDGSVINIIACDVVAIGSSLIAIFGRLSATTIIE